MLDNAECNPYDNPKISIILDKMGVSPYRSGSYLDLNPDRPQDGKYLGLNSLFTKNITGVLHNVPLTEAQLGTFMETLRDQNISHLDLTFNNFDDNALRVILNNLPQTVKILNLTDNNFTENSIRLLKEFNATHPECAVSTNEYTYNCIQSVDTSNDMPMSSDTLDHTGECSILGSNESESPQPDLDLTL